MKCFFVFLVGFCIFSQTLFGESDQQAENRKKYEEMLKMTGDTIKDFNKKKESGELKAAAGDIFDAAMCGDIKELLRILKENPGKAKDKLENGETPLHRAINFNQKKAIGALVKFGADVNAVGADNATPLIDAASNGEAKIIKFLVSKGANLESVDNYGYTPLHWAAQKGHIEAIKMLLESGANKNAKDKQGRIPADLADLMEKPEAAKLLR